MASNSSHSAPLPAIRAAVPALLAKGHGQPCSAGAQAFASLVPPTTRFQVALDTLLPILERDDSNPADRILTAYILFALYAPHPISINPFAPTLREIFYKERHAAISAKDPAGTGPLRYQLVWVLWQVLRGDGDDLSPYTPSTLARSALPPEFHPEKLALDEPTYTPDFTRHLSHTASQRSSSSHSPSPESDAHLERLSHGASLLLAARSRVLTLSELKTLTPLLPDLTSPPFLTSTDIPPLASQNPSLTHALIVHTLFSPSSPTRPSPGLSASTSNGFAPPTPPNPRATALSFLYALTTLPPTLASFDLLGRLLTDRTAVPDLTRSPPFASPGATPPRTVGGLARAEVLGLFLAHAIAALDRAEADERAGLVSDDRLAVGVQHLCRFFSALLQRGLVDARDDADTAPMAAFALRHARFAAANALYVQLAGAGAGLGG